VEVVFEPQSLKTSAPKSLSQKEKRT